MGKSKKKKNADFQKVKLKVGKRLKKADNVTNASFHTRSIQINQQLKSQAEEPSTKRKLNLSDLLSQCQHYNISVRHDAVTGLRELLLSHPGLINSHLASVLDKVSQLYTDKDAVVRAAVVKLLKTVLPAVSVNQIKPFFPVVSAHLCCAMTHIYDEIQADSLQLLDVFLETLPSLVIEKSSQILPNFIDQISRQKVGSKNRSLSVNPNNKMASQKWRANVLNRLHKLLSAILGQTLEKKTTVTNSWETGADGLVKWEAGRPTCHQPFSSAVMRSWSSPGFELRSTRSSVVTRQDEKSVSLNDERGIQKFVKTIVPLLIECWIEASAGHGSNSDGSLLSPDSFLLKSNVLSVIQLLWECVINKNPQQVTWLRTRYQTDFQNYFLQHFPYSIHSSVNKKSKKDRSATSETSALSLNLAICDLMTHFLPSSANEEQQTLLPWETQISDFLLTVLQDESADVKHTQVMIKIMRRMIDSHFDPVYLTKMMVETFRRYSSAHPLSSEKRMLVVFFSDLVLQVQSSFEISSYIKDKYLLSLPELFTHVAKTNQQMAAQIMNTLKEASCQKCLMACQSLQNFVVKTIVSHKDLLLELEPANQRLFVELLLYVDCLDKATTTELAMLMQKLPTDSCTYAIQVLQQRYNRQKWRVQETANHISFLITVLLGDRNLKTDTKQQKYCDKSIDMTLDEDLWMRIESVTQVIGEQLISFPNVPQIADVVTSLLAQHLMNTNNFTVGSVGAVILLTNQISIWNHPVSSDFTTQLVDLIWSCILNMPEDWCSPHCHNNSWMSSLTQELITYLINTKDALNNLLVRMTNLLKGADEEIDVMEICQPAHRLLQQENIRTKIQTTDCMETLKTSMTDIQSRFEGIVKQQWWSDFSFTVCGLHV